MINSNVAEANAWIRKYFKDASVVNILSLLEIRGINDNKLISNPIHAPNQEFDEIVINNPLIKVDKNRIFVEVWVTRRERFFLYKWGMNPLA